MTPRAFVVGIILLVIGGLAARSEEPIRQDQRGELAGLPSAAHPTIGERLSFHGRWMGIPVGSGWIEVKGLMTLNGRQVIHIEAQGHTNEVLSQFYPIHDVIHSYLDAETFAPVRFEKHQREGRYRAEEVVSFDLERSIATYRSLLNGSEKQIQLPDMFQDLISALYWFRRQPLGAGQAMMLNLYTDEKIYRTEVLVEGPTLLELLKRGTFQCMVVEPKASFRGLLVKRGRIWAYFSADERRLPLIVKATTPWGQMSAVLDETSIPRELRQNKASRRPSSP